MPLVNRIRPRAHGGAAAAPAVLLTGAACIQAWAQHGSIAAGDWLPCAILAALLAAVALVAGAARPSRLVATGLGLLLAFAVLQAASAAWAPVPSLARDDALLTALYVAVLAVAAFSFASPAARLGALWVAALGFGAFAVATAVVLLAGPQPLTRFYAGRLYFPITYADAQGSLFLAAFWPGVVLAARAKLALPARVLALAAAGAGLAGAVLAQSKGSLLGLGLATLVVTVLAPSRLRLLLTAALAAAPAAFLFSELTAPYRDESSATPIRHAGAAVLLATGAAAVLGLLLALADRRFDLAPRRAAIGRAVGALAALAVVVGAIAFVASVGSPTRWASDRWSSFKHYAPVDTSSSHFSSLGSNRYDFWRAALRMFERHPVVGCGARCFGTEYLLDRRSPERPQRAHSLFFDTAAEEGVVGLALLFGGLGSLLVAAGRGARLRRAPAIAGLAGFVTFLGQCLVDWTWTFAAVGIAYALLLGTAVAEESRGRLDARRGRIGAAIALAVTVVALMPPWLSARLTRHGLATGSHGDLVWAHRLDPLSTAPLIAEAVTAPDAASELRALRAAVDREPRVVADRYFLGVALLNLGRTAEARTQLEEALRLDPGNPSVELALAKLR